jgi:hypothetical protein
VQGALTVTCIRRGLTGTEPRERADAGD